VRCSQHALSEHVGALIELVTFGIQTRGASLASKRKKATALSTCSASLLSPSAASALSIARRALC